MSQPEHAPVERADRVRRVEQTPPARRWQADRPGEALTAGGPPAGKQFGKTGPDQGYGLKLVRRLEDRLTLAPGEHSEDALAGITAVGLKRAALLHRAPVIFDFDLAATVWGYSGGAPDDLVAFRRPLFATAAHEYAAQRAIADRVPDDTLRLTPEQARARLGEWRTLLAAE